MGVCVCIVSLRYLGREGKGREGKFEKFARLKLR